ncbi:GNAT family N-acetyltransferase [Pseudobutyrivibrio xylanivorans]|uniref:Acetyltransferase (GNAT) domain-containing protein n=1 Tax=Pseudobutyrivibrio xylanivorans DSM 14809 TaxID=1123012 RepID=A0A1M6GEY6_PSEXY|nr:GNAT family protein [Pseudobutyrivibrio xylanivorans]SHJ08441.1 Acetyltransferase (GNAT) domain-containing protein [Pseudobutyrivibrio xylanivorans DSM 14809]
MWLACTELLRRAFEDLNVEKVWCAYYQGNEKSKRVQEKLGFKYHDTQEKVKLQLLDEVRTNIMNLMTKEDWLKLVNC